MVFGRRAADHRAMTTEQPRAERRLLRRNSSDRVIGGVASGIGDYLNVDPLLIRIGFVGLMVFGGLGLILYVAGWILIPEDNESESIGGQLLDRTGLTTQRFLVGGLIALGIFVLFWGISPSYGDDNFAAALVVGLVIIVVGSLFLRQNEPTAIAAQPVADAEGGATPTATTRPAPRQRVARIRRPRSPLAGYVMGVTLAALGVLALVANASNLDVELGQYFGLILAAIGLGLIVGAWWGHARVLILLGLVILPFAWAASLIHVPLEGGFGAHSFSPTTVDELRPEYRLVGGELWIDLWQLEETSDPIEVTATVAMGQIVVKVPSDARVEVNAAVGGGDLRVLDRWQSGTNVSDRQVSDGDGPHITLDLEAGVGSVHVDRISPDMEEELGL